MINDAELKKNLSELRTQIRTEEGKNGILPFVCSDFAIDQMVKQRPATKDDICAIPTVSDDFRHRYADRFLESLGGKCPGAVQPKMDNDKVLAVLNNLSKKLTNLRDSNQMLMLKGESSDEYLDLSAFGLTADQLLQGESISLCGTSSADIPIREHIDNILAEVRNCQRDRGHNLLYVAYPFVEGLIERTGVRLRAPLALIPVVIEKSAGKYVMKFDTSRDVVVNNVLVMAVLESQDDIAETLSPVLDISSEVSFEEAVRNSYADHFKIDGEFAVGDVPLEELKSESYDPAPGFRVLNCCVLGKFSNDSGALQRDYAAIRDVGVPPVVRALLGKDLEDIYFEYDGDNLQNGCDISECDLRYLSPLNASQEQILGAIGTEDAIVIQGPPGTGKSEAITAAVVDMVDKGHNVLVVSEKKTALDVVKNRLGTLGKYALVIENSGDKEAFYKQISEFWNTEASRPVSDVGGYSKEIDSLISELADIDREIYRPIKGFGISAAELYSYGRFYDFSKPLERERFTRTKAAVTPMLLTIDFPTLDMLYRDSSDQGLISTVFEHLSLCGNGGIASKLRNGLTENDLLEFISAVEAVKKMKKGGILGRNRDRDKALQGIVADYFIPGATAEDVEAAIEADLNSIIPKYRQVSTVSEVFGRCDAVHKEYFESLYSLANGDSSKVPNVSKALFECILYLHLDEFDGAHSGVKASIANFDSIVGKIRRTMEDKESVERDFIESRLTSAIKAISGSSKRADIQNILYNSTNKYPIGRFMQRFGDVMLKNIKIWLMTPDAVSDVLPFAREPIFDLLIFDEASQIYVERAIPAICRAKKVVVAGDSKQLRPTALPGSARVKFGEDLTDYDSEVDIALEQESLLDLARLCFQSYTLNCHYRSRYEELIQFSNRAFYHGKLMVAPNCRMPEESPIEYLPVEGMWHEQKNTKEAKAVAELISKIVRTEGHGTIGVIAFNLKQSRQIVAELSKMRSKDPELDRLLNLEEHRTDEKGADVKLFIENIEHVQGDERDIIIFSTTYARDINGSFYQRFGWLNTPGGENRLNVAVTRAKEKVYIVTSIQSADISSMKEGPRLLAKYLEYSKAVSDYYLGTGSKQAISQVLREVGTGQEEFAVPTRGIMLDRVYETLMNKGFQVDRDVGIGGTTLDLAVKKGDGYIAGILADTSLYKGNSTVRGRDLHDPEYLQLRGWDTIRLWTPSYWENPAKEIERICKRVAELSSAKQ